MILRSINVFAVIYKVIMKLFSVHFTLVLISFSKPWVIRSKDGLTTPFYD